jgi:hypothetical protein
MTNLIDALRDARTILTLLLALVQMLVKGYQAIKRRRRRKRTMQPYLKAGLSTCMTKLATTQAREAALPPILAGNFTPDVRRRVEQFFFSVASCRFLGLAWPDQATELLRVSIKDVQAFRDQLVIQRSLRPRKCWPTDSSATSLAVPKIADNDHCRRKTETGSPGTIIST